MKQEILIMGQNTSTLLILNSLEEITDIKPPEEDFFDNFKRIIGYKINFEKISIGKLGEIVVDGDNHKYSIVPYSGIVSIQPVNTDLDYLVKCNQDWSDIMQIIMMTLKIVKTKTGFELPSGLKERLV
jgi:hypothetical protein